MAQMQKRTFTKEEQERRDKLAVKMELDRKRDRKMVTGVFRFFELPGGKMEFPFRKYKGDPIEKISLTDNETATIPLGAAKHLNKNCWYPAHTYRTNERGQLEASVSEKIRRCGFNSLEFMDIEGLDNSAEEVISVDESMNKKTMHK